MSCHGKKDTNRIIQILSRPLIYTFPTSCLFQARVSLKSKTATCLSMTRVTVKMSKYSILSFLFQDTNLFTNLTIAVLNKSISNTMSKSLKPTRHRSTVLRKRLR